MDYQFENLGHERFQEFCQSLLVREFPSLQCFPVGQRDGGRDAVAYYLQGQNEEFIVFQVKFNRKPLAEKDPHKWLLEIMEEERTKIKALIPKGAQQYYLLTNVPGTAFLGSGSIDRAHALLRETTGIPSQCWWRGDIQARLDNAWDLKWAYPELLTGQDIIRWLVEAGLSEDKERRSNAIRAFIRNQFTLEENVRFKQIELQNKLLDLFIDVPVIPRESPRERKKRNSGYMVISRLAQTLVGETYGAASERPDQTLTRRSNPREEDSLGAATMLLHRNVQRLVPFIVLEGAPGQGKSTITQYICQIHRMQILNEQVSLAEVPPDHKAGSLRLPIRVDLRDLATWFAGQDPFTAGESDAVPQHWHKSLESFLAALIRHHAGGIEFAVNDLHAVAKTSALLLVLDGLDEVADISRRKEVVDEVLKGIGRLADSACSVEVIVTSRPAAFANSPGMPDTEFQYCELGSLTKPLITTYATKWLRARRLQGHEAAEVNRILREKLDQPHLRDLARNPMQLAILLSLIHTRGASLPDKRTALYDSYIELFFSREAEKSPIVREHRELLIEIHRYLAWVLHSESEQGRSRGSLKSDELKQHVSSYLKREGYDTSLAEHLFRGMIERVVALVSRVEGTYEFEVQPLREYFAGRFLYETATYSPPGGERCGTLPDRFDAIARNFFWLNVTRFYAGCFSKGELPSLVDRLEELVRAPRYHMTSHPRVLAATLLADWVFSQHPKSMRKVVSLILDSLGLRRFVAVGGQQRSATSPLILPKQCGKEELVEQCFSILRGRPPRDFAMSLIELLLVNSSLDERRDAWKAAVSSVGADERTRWIDYGLHMQVLADLPEVDFDALMSEGNVNGERGRIVFRLPHLARWQENEERFMEIATAILEGEIGSITVSREPRHLLHLFAQAHNLWRFGVALHRRHAVPLAAAWEDYPNTWLPQFPKRETVHIPAHAAAQRCWEFVDTVRACAEAPIEDWASSLSQWEVMIERSRDLFGDHWVQCRLACLGSGIRSMAEQCNDFPSLFDASKSLSRRVRYARLRAGQPTWWEKQLEQAKCEFDSSLALLILLTWGSPNCLTSLAPVIGQALDALSTSSWVRVWEAIRQVVSVTHGEVGESMLNIQLGALPAHLSERMIAAFGERADQEAAAALYKQHLKGYAGSDVPVLYFAQRQAMRLLFSKEEDRAIHLSMIERSYSRGVITEEGVSRWRHSDGQTKLSTEVCEQIASHPDRYPMELVGLAERLCREKVAADITPVGVVAQQENWFPAD